jgi:hypothetical protein
MAHLKLNWAAPTTRTSGRPLRASDIAGFSLSRSHDGGEFERVPDFAADATEHTIENIEPGIWAFRLACFDTNNRSGAAAEGSIEVPDDSPPGVVLNLTLSIVSGIATSQG